MDYRKQYKKEEIEEAIAWFENHKDSIPQSLDLDKATHIPNFPQTLHNYIEIARIHRENPTYSGQIFALFNMREAMKQLCNIAD